MLPSYCPVKHMRAESRRKQRQALWAHYKKLLGPAFEVNKKHVERLVARRLRALGLGKIEFQGQRHPQLVVMERLPLSMGKRRRRRNWSDDEKRMICAQARMPGVSVKLQ